MYVYVVLLQRTRTTPTQTCGFVGFNRLRLSIVYNIIYVNRATLNRYGDNLGSKPPGLSEAIVFISRHSAVIIITRNGVWVKISSAVFRSPRIS